MIRDLLSDACFAGDLQHSRRRFLATAAAVIFAGCDSATQTAHWRIPSVDEGGLKSTLPVRQTPLVLNLYPDPSVSLSDAQLKAVARVAAPPRSLRGAATCARIERYLRDLSVMLAGTQRGDGAWGSTWFQHPTLDDVAESDRALMIAAGHHLEWMTICPPGLRPKGGTMRAAAEYCASRIPTFEPAVESDWHFYYPLTHAVKALYGLRGKRFAEWRGGG